ncbi:MAG: cation diffusion facilitator family transporter [Candidatus Gracilibacteria bacterium]|nr:cation diffusion facilitator family transporter [Candidatus Gracilibacteria bacterium]
MENSALREGERLAKESAIHLLLLGGAKIFTGFITGMTVVLADGINTMASVLSIFASYIGLKFSRKSADKNFEYGYHRVETFSAFLVSLGIVVLGYIMITKSLGIIMETEEGAFRPFAITITVITMIHSYKLSKKLKKMGEKINSLSLLANAKNKRMAFFAGCGVLISIIANYKGVPYVEGTISMIISLIVLKEGLFSTKESLFFLLDYWNDPVLSRKIRKALGHEKDIVLKVNKVRLRRAGAFIFGEAFIDINQFAGIRNLKEELDILEEKICEMSPYIKDFVIFTHVSRAEKVKVGIPIKNKKDLNSEIASSLKETVAYLFVTLHDKKIGKPNIKTISESQKSPVGLAEFLKKEKMNILVDNKLGSMVYFNLKETHHVVIYPNFSDIKTAKQILELMLIDT